SSSCFPTWEVQILEHSPSQRKASLACGPRFSQKDPELQDIWSPKVRASRPFFYCGR
ncbi:unnamed protein product, partial [Heterosigma akashiwo]